jgi:hypothetical protein
MSPIGSPGESATSAAVRTPRAAALAGIIFSVLLIVALVLIRRAIPANPDDAGRLLTDSSTRHSVLFALGLVPFSGIAFLWFIGVVRDLIGDAEDRFFATVFLGSGILFVAMLFASAALAGGLVSAAGHNGTTLVSSGVWSLGRRATYTLLTVFAMRMAAVFIISTSTILLRTRAAPRWLAISGYVFAAILLVTVGSFAWIELLFPIWVLVLSVYVLLEVRGAPGVSREQ